MRCNVFIIGAGPAGLAAAIALASNGCSVVLVERDGFDQRRIGEHVPPEVKPILAQIGYATISAEHLASAGVLSFWKEGHVGERIYFFSPHGTGWNLTRPAFDAGLAKLARQVGVHLIVNANLQLLNGPPNWRFKVDCPEMPYEFQSDFAIDASGRQAWLLRKLGVRRTYFDDRVAGIVYVKQHPSDTDTRLVVESDGDDWWYSLPLRDQFRAIALVSSSRTWTGSRKSREALWSRRLRATGFIRKLVGYEAPARVKTCSASVQASTLVCGETWLAIGDAAVCFDPLAGHGINKALADGLRVPDIIGAGGNRHIYEPAAFQAEAEERLQEHLRQRREFYAAVDTAPPR